MILIFILLTSCYQQPPKPIAVPKKVILVTLQNQTIDFASLAGKWVIINYWASWCKPCYQEIPELNRLAKQYPDTLSIFGVSYDQVEPDQLPILVKKMQIQFPVLKYNPAMQLGIRSIPVLPATYIFNPQGRLVKTLFGKQTQKSLLVILSEFQHANFAKQTN